MIRPGRVRLLALELWCEPPQPDVEPGELLLADSLGEALDWFELAAVQSRRLLILRTVGHAVFAAGRDPSRGREFSPDIWSGAVLLPHRPRIFYPESSNIVALRPRGIWPS